MPFNRINNVKATSVWLAMLQTYADEEDNLSSTESDKSPLTEEQLKERRLKKYLKAIEKHHISTCWIPGILVVPIPEAGWFLGYVDVAFWATMLYVIGSVFYVVDSFYLWYRVNPAYTDDANNPAIYLNTLSAVTFVLNALVCFLDWYLQVRQLSAMNYIVDEDLTGGLHVSDIPTKITLYYFLNNFFFLGAAVIFMIQSIWWENPNADLQNCSPSFCGLFWINFWGGWCYLMSAVFSCAESFEDRAIRKRDNLPMVYLFTTNMYDFDWFGWGDLLLVLPSVSSVIQCFFMFDNNITDDDNAVFYLYTNFLFLLDSVVYLIGYVFFIWEIQNCLKTGFMPASQTTAISHLIGENYDEQPEENEEDPSSSSQQEHRETTTQRKTDVFGKSTSERSSEFRKTFVAHQNDHGMVNILDIQRSLKSARMIRLRRTEAMIANHLSLAKESAGTLAQRTSGRMKDDSMISGNSSLQRGSAGKSSIGGGEDVINPIRNTISSSSELTGKEKPIFLKSVFSVAAPNSKDI